MSNGRNKKRDWEGAEPVKHHGMWWSRVRARNVEYMGVIKLKYIYATTGLMHFSEREAREAGRAIAWHWNNQQ